MICLDCQKVVEFEDTHMSVLDADGAKALRPAMTDPDLGKPEITLQTLLGQLFQHGGQFPGRMPARQLLLQFAGAVFAT